MERRDCVVLVLVVAVVACAAAQTFQYSNGWTAGKKRAQLAPGAAALGRNLRKEAEYRSLVNRVLKYLLDQDAAYEIQSAQIARAMQQNDLSPDLGNDRFWAKKKRSAGLQPN